MSLLNGNIYLLLNHYYKHGLIEGRISNEKEFYTLYPEFCLDFYEKYQKNLDFFNKDKYLLMYYYNEVFTNKLFKININSKYFDEAKLKILNYHNSLININNSLKNIFNLYKNIPELSEYLTHDMN